MFDYYVFVDESGDLGAKGTSVFVMVALETNDERQFRRVIRQARTKKLRRFEASVELKAAFSSNRVRDYVLRRLARTDCRIVVLCVQKDGLFLEAEQQNALYDAACVELCRHASGSTISVVLDKRYTRPSDRQHLESKLIAALSARGVNASVQHVPSQERDALQAVDFIAWAALQKFAGKNEAPYALLRSKIVSESTWRVDELLGNAPRVR